MNKKLLLSFIPLCITMFLCVTATGLIYGLSSYQLIRIDLLLAVCFFCIVFYIRYRCAEIFNRIGTTVTLCIGIVLATALMLLTQSYTVIPVWIFGILIIARRVDVGLSLLFIYTTVLLQMLSGGITFIEVFIPLIIGTLLCILSSYIHSFITAFFVFIIALSMQVTILFVWNHFDIKAIINEQTIRYVLVMSALSFVMFYVDNIISIIKSSMRDVNKTYFNISDEELSDSVRPGEILVSASYEAKTEERRLLKKLNQMKNEYNSLEKAASELKAETIKKEKDKERIQSEIESLKLMKDSYKAETASIELDTDTMRTLNKSLHDETEKLKNDNNALKEELSSLRAEVEAAYSDCEDMQKRNEQLKNEAELLAAENNALNESLESVKAEIAKIGYNPSEHKTQVATVTAVAATKEKPASDNALLQRLKAELPKVYKHCLKVADISSKAAHIISADKALTYAGGLYHEVNKLMDNKPMSDIADYLAVVLPESLVDIIMQCNARDSQPHSREACIITLTDDIITTMNYLKNTGNNNITYDKIVENVFRLRKGKGMFNNAFINSNEIDQLKAYFIEWNGGTN